MSAVGRSIPYSGNLNEQENEIYVVKSILRKNQRFSLTESQIDALCQDRQFVLNIFEVHNANIATSNQNLEILRTLRHIPSEEFFELNAVAQDSMKINPNDECKVYNVLDYPKIPRHSIGNFRPEGPTLEVPALAPVEIKVTTPKKSISPEVSTVDAEGTLIVKQQSDEGSAGTSPMSVTSINLLYARKSHRKVDSTDTAISLSPMDSDSESGGKEIFPMDPEQETNPLTK